MSGEKKKCIKCGSENIVSRYYKARQLINSSSFTKIENEFVTSSEYDLFFKLTAKVEHLFKACECGYSWRDSVIDLIERGEG